MKNYGHMTVMTVVTVKSAESTPKIRPEIHPGNPPEKTRSSFTRNVTAFHFKPDRIPLLPPARKNPNNSGHTANIPLPKVAYLTDFQYLYI